jgi:hypothetical protein
MQNFNHTSLSISEILNAYRNGNNAGWGFSVGEETDLIFDIAGIGELVARDNEIAVYQNGSELIAVGNANGPWAVRIAPMATVERIENHFASFDDDVIGGFLFWARDSLDDIQEDLQSGSFDWIVKEIRYSLADDQSLAVCTINDDAIVDFIKQNRGKILAAI